MVPTLQSTNLAELQSELREIKLQTKCIRIQHCIKRFMIWRNAGYSPHEMQIIYHLSTRDMYGTILDAVQSQTGIDRDTLLKCPGCGRGPRDAMNRSSQLKEELSETQKYIEVYRNLIEQADILLKVIYDTLK